MHIIHIDGRGASGKTTLIRHLNERLGWEPTKNYTSRKPRYEGEEGYDFITDDEFIDKIKHNEVLESYFRQSNQAFYGTKEPTQSGIYQSEIMARVALQKWCMQNEVPFLSIFLEIDEDELLRRLVARNDKNEDPHTRLKEDRYYEIFKNWCDVVYDYNDKDVTQGVSEVLDIIQDFMTHNS